MLLKAGQTPKPTLNLQTHQVAQLGAARQISHTEGQASTRLEFEVAVLRSTTVLDA